VQDGGVSLLPLPHQVRLGAERSQDVLNPRVLHAAQKLKEEARDAAFFSAIAL
jgi:hypothetical protein